MKHLYLAILFIFCSTLAWSQDGQPKPKAGDVIVEDENNGGFYYESVDDFKDRRNKHWQGLDIGINGLSFQDGAKPPEGYEFLEIDYARSWYFGVNLFEVGIPINGELIKIVTGLGFDFNNIQLRNDYIMQKDGDTLSATLDSTRSFCNNNMKNSHITVPLLLGFNTSPKNSTSYHIAVGAIFSYRLNGKQKIGVVDDGIKQVLTRQDRMLQNPFRVNATLRLGYGDFHIFGNYCLTEYWEDGRGPEAYLWSVGLKVIPW